MIFRLCW